MTVGTTAGTYTANNLNQYTTQTGPANTFTHDFDGNLSQITGTRNVVFTYDGENRLLSVQPVTPVANNKRLEFVYDYQGRRVQKLVITGAAVHGFSRPPSASFMMAGTWSKNKRPEEQRSTMCTVLI